MSPAEVDISSLSTEQRLELIEKLWDSLADDPSTVPVIEAQKAELDRRLDAMERGEGENIPLHDALARVRIPRDQRQP